MADGTESNSPYEKLAAQLRAIGIATHLQNPDQMVVSNRNPATPTLNCFWVSRRNGVWYIGTFLPAVYEIHPDQDPGQACEAVFKSSQTAIYVVDPELAERLKLRRLDVGELRQKGFAP